MDNWVSTSFRETLGKAFEILGEEITNLVIVTSDVGKSVKTAGFQKKYPERFINVGIAEQNAIGMSAGLSSVGFKALYSAYAMFAVGRPWEIIRNYICYPKLDVTIVASHGGINVGQDGVTHQATEDIAIMRVLPNMKVLAVSDPSEVIEAIRVALADPGPVYVRLGRINTTCLQHKESWQIGKGETLRNGNDVAIIATGLLVEQGLKAAETLAVNGVNCRVINIRSIKPIDQDLILKAANETKLIVTAEDHNIYGGLFSAVSEVLASQERTSRIIPVAMKDRFAESGDGLKLMDKYGLNSSAIITVIKDNLKKGVNKLQQPKLAELRDKTRLLRARALQMIYQSQSGHPGGSLSLAEIMAVLYFHIMRIKPDQPKWEERDRFIMSKGHAAPILYASLIEKSFISENAMAGFRQIDGLLQGHPVPKIPGVDSTSGSLGVGLSIGSGMAKGLKMRHLDSRVFVVMGDGELNEGIAWESIMAAPHFKLDNLIAIIDNNHYQNDGPCSQIMNLEPIAKKWESFGWQVENANGHDIEQLVSIFENFITSRNGCPKVLVADTIKGHGVSYLEQDYLTHYVAPTDSQWNSACDELGWDPAKARKI